MRLTDLDVAIAGAGIGGLSLAIMLARGGVRVTIYDQLERPRAVGSGFVLQPPGALVIESLGLLAEVEARGARIHRMLGRLSRNGRRVLDVGYREGEHGTAIQRVTLFNLLLRTAIAAGVRFETGRAVREVETGSKPALIFANGQKSPAVDLVVDTMGANSPIELSPRTELAYGALWATVPWPVDGPFQADLLEQRYERARRMAGVLPVGTEREGAPEMATFFWSLRNRDINAWSKAGRGAWVKEVEKLWPEAAPFAAQAQPIYARYRHQTRHPVIGRGAIRIGDAWHATSPQLGQGANMALIDAASLFLALQRGETLRSSVATHLKQRRSHIKVYQTLSRVLTPFYQSDSRLLPATRDLLIGPMTTMPVVRHLITRVVTGDLMNPIKRIGLVGKP
ncbi:FAD-dependent oxidoreductase [Rhizobium halophytocola]|uniref:2-polyprenyl-6-methoxyphenol hydroxylase-like FAD-dependent oxidoreductase n=1 Tax=Rhizobium halophytocola TaxID=735519 RepID=A0ABS4DWI0_9HYPH|nr:NAD(P)/FAD-dependent oxidoreductase [Rhizobium halophytocola]MBP1850050.1 2-polyprenyl-6-methoxyphenol hydroxylase-like FAD-dependent oxidoreductase [Rhizobium halophytocola]